MSGNGVGDGDVGSAAATRISDRSAAARGAGHGRSSAARSADDAVALNEPLLDCDAAAALLNVRPSWVRDAARLGRLPCLRVGRHLRFTRSMLEAWLGYQISQGTAGRGSSRLQAGRFGRRPAAGAFRESAPAALLASLAEHPAHAEPDDDT